MHNQWWFLIHITCIPNIHDFHRNAACKCCIWINIPASVRSCWYRWFLLFTRLSSVLIFCISGKFWIVYFTTKALHAPAAYIIYYSICACFWGPYACCYMPLIASSNCWLDLRPKIKPATLNHNQSRSCPWVKKVSITSVLFRHFPGLDMIDILCDIALRCVTHWHKHYVKRQGKFNCQNLWVSEISLLHFFFFVRAPTGAFIPVYCMEWGI